MTLLRSTTALVSLASLISAQPAFEAASFKASESGRAFFRGGPGTPDPGRITWENVPLKDLLKRAWHLEDDQVSGPAWINSQRYTIAATLPSATTREQFDFMLRNLITERLQMKVRRESKEFTVWELIVVKGGAKQLATAAPTPEGDAPPMNMNVDKDGCPVVNPGVKSERGRTIAPGILCNKYTSYTMTDLIGSLAMYVAGEVDGIFGGGAHLVDKTGLTGTYDFTLKFHAAGSLPGMPSRADPLALEGPSVFTALEQQLGLKLQKTKAPLDVITIDSANKVPIDN